MKTKSLIIRWLLLILLAFTGTVGAWAQGPYPHTGDQTVCITGVPEPYGVINTLGSRYTWTVDGATSGSPNWSLVSDGSNLATITWLAQGTYRVQVSEMITATQCPGEVVFINVTVNPRPTATIIGTTAICQNAEQPVITFTGEGGIAPYTFTYNINGGANQTVTTTSGNSVTVAVPTANAGTFTYNLISVQDANTPSCSQPQTGSAVVTVVLLPTAIISGTTSVCQNAAQPVITFEGANGTAPYTFTYNINGGANQTVTTTSGNSVTVAVPTANSGTFTYNLVSVQDASATTCSQAQTGSAVVTIVQLPTATISGTTSVCQNAAQPVITFEGANGTAPYTFTYNINGGANQTVTTTSGNSLTVAVPTANAGTFTYNLVSVQDASATTCSQAQTGSAVITVVLLPTATISGTTSVCQNATQPVITFEGANGTAPYTFTYNINGGANQTVTTTSGNSVAVAVPTANAGTFTYNLVSVQDASATTCSQAQTGSAIVTVVLLPTATISGTTSVCQNATQPVITFEGANGTAPYTFTYNINGGANQTVTTTSGNSVTVAVPTANSGTFTYNLVSVQDASATTCSQAQTGSAIVTVVLLPTATISGTTSVCQNATQPVITFEGANGTAPYTFTYNINGSANQTVTTTSGNSVTVAVPTTTAGTFTYNLVSVQDASATTCSQAQTGSAIVTVVLLPTATISGSVVVCQSDAQPVITFTGANGTAPYTFTYNINGGANQTVTTTSGNSVTVAVPTTTAGTFTYNLVSVQDASSTACAQAQTGSAVVNVNPLPTPVITGPSPVCQSINGATETYSVPNSGNTFNWTVVGGTFTGQGSNQITVTWTTSGAGSVSVTETVGSSGCSATVTNNIQVLPAPVTSPIYHN